jgi:two-component system cell cycle sensor histidine kinase/response regulator CckA
VAATFPSGASRILLVEDQAEVRRLARRLLEIHGYTVLSAADGTEALAVSEAYEGSIELLVTDVTMPGMNGPDVARALEPGRPHMKTLYMSGHALAQLSFLEEGVSFLQKPFTSDALAGKVREALDGPGRT